MLVDRAENQVDNLAPICSCPRMIRQGFQQGLQHKHNVREAKGPHTAAPALPACQLHLRAQQGRHSCLDVQAPRAHCSLNSMRESDTSSKGLIS